MPYKSSGKTKFSMASCLIILFSEFFTIRTGHLELRNIAVLEQMNTVVLEHCCILALQLALEHFGIVALELNCIVVLEQSYTPPLGHSGTVVWEHWSTVALERCYTLDGECCCRPPLQLFLGLGYIVEMEHFGTLALEQSYRIALVLGYIPLLVPALGCFCNLVLQQLRSCQQMKNQ